MKGLHELRPTYLQPTIFFGPDSPCMDTYHNGYSNERTLPWDHQQCAIRIFQDANIITAQACECPECGTNFARPDVTRTSHWVVWEHTVRLDRLNRGQSIGICLSCLAGNHVTFDTSMVDTRLNPLVGTPGDGIDEPEDPGPDHEHHWFENENGDEECHICGDILE